MRNLWDRDAGGPRGGRSAVFPPSQRSVLEPRPELQRLLVGSAREVLERLLDGDPLGLRARCAAELERRALFLDPATVVATCFARVAYDASDLAGRDAWPYGGPCGDWGGDWDRDWDQWLAVRMERSLLDALRQQWEDELRGLALAECEGSAFYQRIAGATGLPLRASRLACIAWNALPLEIRSAVHAVALEGVEPREYARRVELPLPRVRRSLAEARRAFARALSSGPLPPPPI